jgi:hypothetical protein
MSVLSGLNHLDRLKEAYDNVSKANESPEFFNKVSPVHELENFNEESAINAEESQVLRFDDKNLDKMEQENFKITN